MHTERIDGFKREIASKPLTTERLLELAQTAWNLQKSIAGEVRHLFDESAEIQALAQPLGKLWQLTKADNPSSEEPPAVSLDESSLDLVLETPIRRLSGNLRDMTLTAAEIEVAELPAINQRAASVGNGVVHVDAVHDRLVGLIEHLIREAGYNTTASEVLAKWKHPKSAISSVLYQSKQWTRVRKGEYKLIGPSSNE